MPEIQQAAADEVWPNEVALGADELFPRMLGIIYGRVR